MRHWRVMLAMFQAGFVAATFQLLTVAFATITVWFLWRSSVGEWLPPFMVSRLGPSTMALSFLAWAYLLTAVGFALTHGRSVEATAQRIHVAAQIIQPKDPADVAKALFVQ